MPQPGPARSDRVETTEAQTLRSDQAPERRPRHKKNDKGALQLADALLRYLSVPHVLELMMMAEAVIRELVASSIPDGRRTSVAPLAAARSAAACAAAASRAAGVTADRRRQGRDRRADRARMSAFQGLHQTGNIAGDGT